MKPDWDRLADQAHPSVFIVDVNCATQTDLCNQVGVGGYPTIKVVRFDQDGRRSIEDYHGGREYDDLANFCATQLAKPCLVHDATSTCSAKAQAYIDKWQAREGDSIRQEQQRLQGMAQTAVMAPDLRTWLRERLEILQQL